MVQEKKKGMENSNEKKGRSISKEEEEKSSMHKPTGKISPQVNKNHSPTSKKSR